MRPVRQREETERLSDIIGVIYDCALEPTRWQETLDRLRELLNCANCLLYVLDPRNDAIRLHKAAGIGPYWLARMEEYGPDIAAMHARVPDFVTRPLDEPFVCTQDIPKKVWLANRFFREWAEPQAIVDVIDTVLMRRSDRLGSCALCRHQSAGLITDREVAIVRLLAPHLRRAVTISDLIDMKSVQANAFGETLDALSAGVVLVAEDGAILHANQAAKRMLDVAQPITSRGGRLHTRERETTGKLRRVIAIAACNETELGASEFGVALTSASGDVATAHVLPLAGGGVRSRLVPRAVAAVFVASSAERFTGALHAFTRAFGLTPSETRLLERLVQGESITAAAASLGVAKTTVKTHLARILAKTGTRRQTSLLSLVHRLSPAVKSSAQPHPR